MKRKLQVFVSSTYSDLIEERQAAVAAILKAGHIPAGMELFTAGDKSQMKTIERWIDESDVFMLILGGRYGSIEPSTGLSYTELEYDYAISKSKPFFSIVIRDEALDAKVKTHGRSALEEVNQNALPQFRSKVLGKMSSFFSDEKDVTFCVHESLSDFAADPAVKGWVSGIDIMDTSVISEEISRLKDENQTLRERFKKNEQINISTKSSDSDRFTTAFIGLLRLVEVTVPKAVAKRDKDLKVGLLYLVHHNRDILINGITNQQGPELDAVSFLYYNLFPKLQLHGDNEPVPGTSFRRSFLNADGRKLVAKLELDSLQNKHKSAKTTKISEPTESAATIQGMPLGATHSK